MPIYEYVCDDGHEVEFRQGMNDEALAECPRHDCDAPAERKISLGGGVLVRDAAAPEPEGPACGPGCCRLPH